MNPAKIKKLAKDFGADLVGIASAKTLNAFPPDPRWPQTPDNISPHVKSVIVIACHIPVAGFRAKHNIAVQYLDMLVLRRQEELEDKPGIWEYLFFLNFQLMINFGVSDCPTPLKSWFLV